MNLVTNTMSDVLLDGEVERRKRGRFTSEDVTQEAKSSGSQTRLYCLGRPGVLTANDGLIVKFPRFRSSLPQCPKCLFSEPRAANERFDFSIRENE